MSIDKTITAELKASLLAKGINFDLDLFKQIKRPFYDNQFVYGKTSEHVTPEHRFPQVLRLGDNVITALLRRENSPWNLRIEEGEVQLYNGNTHIRTVGLPERPAYFDKTLSDGTRSESIIAVAGEDIPGFFLYPDCYYFSEGKPCGFCSMKSTRKTVGKYMVSEFSEENIVEATKLFQNTPWRDIPLISITMGTCRTDDETREKVIKPIKWMYDALNPKIPIHILAHPPNDYDLIREFKDAGVTSIAFNLEVYDPQRFEELCPGKAQLYGREKWIEALMQAREVFGDYNVFCGLIWGLESPESTIAGHEYFLEERIAIASNIFHADPKSVLRKHSHPTEEQILQIARAEAELFKKYPQSRTIFPVSMRSTLDWEVYRGDFG
ncbi:MAG: radical SAM protein [Candidatus Heimdallarchaeaceae archaeon]